MPVIWKFILIFGLVNRDYIGKFHDVSMDLFINVLIGFTMQDSMAFIKVNLEFILSCPELVLLFMVLRIFEISSGSVGDRNIVLVFRMTF